MRKVGVSDFMEITSLSSPSLSPDACKVAFYTHQVERESNGYRTVLQLLENGRIRELSSEARGNFLWLDESHVLHSIKAAPRGSKFVITDIGTGERKPIIRTSFQASVLGRMADRLFLLQGRVNAADERRLEGLAGEERERELASIQADHDICEVLDEYPFWQNGAGVTNKIRSGLYLYDTVSGNCRKLTKELFDVEAVGFSRDCQQIVYGGVEYESLRPMLGGLYLYDIPTGETRCLLEAGKMEVRDVLFVKDQLIVTACSHDGKTIAQMLDFYRVDRVTGERTLLYAGELSLGNAVGTDCRYSESPTFQVVGDELWFTVSVEEAVHLMRLDLEGNARTVLGGEGTIEGFSRVGDRLVVTALKEMRPHELYEVDLAAQRFDALTHYNQNYAETHELVSPERVRFVNREGNEIHGMVLPPVGHKQGEKTPAILDIHGGPRASYGEVFYHEMQYWAGEGYYVLYCNPTGSLGRGQYFGDVCGKTGKIDYLDLMDFVDRCLDRYPDIDPARLGVTGGSYGGFMTNWIIGHTDRFAAAASQRSTSNNISNEATTGNGRFFTASCLAAGEERTVERLWDQSPLKYVDRAVTPTLFIHALEDYCCYHVEALQMYTALQRLGVETRLCLFKGENHSLSRTGRPASRLRRLKEITRWMDLHLKSPVDPMVKHYVQITVSN